MQVVNITRKFALIDLQTKKRVKISELRSKKFFAEFKTMVDVCIEFCGNMEYRGMQKFDMYFTSQNAPCWQQWGSRLTFPLDSISKIKFVDRNSGETIRSMMVICFVYQNDQEISRGWNSDQQKMITFLPEDGTKKLTVVSYDRKNDSMVGQSYLIEDGKFVSAKDPENVVSELRIKFNDFRFANAISEGVNASIGV